MRLDTLLAALAGGALLAVAGTVNRRRAQAPPLPDAVPSPAPGLPRVAVLLPVRDEEDNLEPCLDTLLAQSVRPEVVVIDDGSADATLALARRRAAGEPRLTVLEAGPLPPGWGGKVHALAVGHRHLAARPGGPPEWLLSTDADTRHHPRLLARALAAAARHRLDLVSLAGLQEVEGAGENLLTPPVFALLDAVLGDWRRAATGHGPAIANGQLLLVREAALARAGGFPALAGVAIDDVGLAVRVRAAGGATGFWRAPDLLRVRMYRGAARVVAGWRRNLGGLFGPRPATAAAAGALALAPATLALASLLTRRPGPAALAWSAGALASALLRQGSGHHPAWGLAYPADALALTATLALGVADWRRGRLAAWKGRPVAAAH
ncbi:MAG TPA: glycosyltransferase family 2 protein [Thermoanaerobaculia bacterium]